MNNNQTNQIDLITTNKQAIVSNAPLHIGVISLSSFLLSFLVGNFIFPGIGIILFAASFVLSIIGLIIAPKYKKQYADISAEQKKRLQWGNGLSLATLILSVLAITTIISLIVMIGVNGFGR